jgi:hypothetical protein
MYPDDPPAPEDAGRHFRIPARRSEWGPLGEPDNFEDVIKRQIERGQQRQADEAPPPRRPPVQR